MQWWGLVKKVFILFHSLLLICEIFEIIGKKISSVPALLLFLFSSDNEDFFYIFYVYLS